MLAAVWLMFSSLLCSLQLSTGSFPKPLTEEEEKHYLALAAQGDLEARNVLIERNLRLVAHIMKKYYAVDSDQEDLISIGTIGLIKGISTFDQSKGARLATYAARCVENTILSPATLGKEKPHPRRSKRLAGVVLWGSDAYSRMPRITGDGEETSARGMGNPLTSIRCWENNRKTINDSCRKTI